MLVVIGTHCDACRRALEQCSCRLVTHVVTDAHGAVVAWIGGKPENKRAAK